MRNIFLKVLVHNVFSVVLEITNVILLEQK